MGRKVITCKTDCSCRKCGRGWCSCRYKSEIAVEELKVECDDARQTRWWMPKISLEVSCLAVLGKHLRHLKIHNCSYYCFRSTSTVRLSTIRKKETSMTSKSKKLNNLDDLFCRSKIFAVR